VVGSVTEDDAIVAKHEKNAFGEVVTSTGLLLILNDLVLRPAMLV
jgi:hypothetical protein